MRAANASALAQSWESAGRLVKWSVGSPFPSGAVCGTNSSQTVRGRPAPTAQKPIRVGGEVQAALLIHGAAPTTAGPVVTLQRSRSWIKRGVSSDFRGRKSSCRSVRKRRF